MELQWPLILFTTFICWSAGLFAVQSIVALKGESAKAQMPSLIASVVLMAVGGISVFFHLQHWERIFNGFGHITSGITQELIAIVVLFVLMVIFFVMIRRDSAKIPAWLCIASIAVAVILVCVMGHSYMMYARPAWNSVFQILSLIGAACALGVGTFAAIDALTAGEDEAGANNGLLALVGTAINAVTTCIYVGVMAASTSSYADYGWTFNAVHPNSALPSADVYSPFASDAMFATIAAIVFAILPILFAAMGKQKGNWKIWGSAIAVCAVISAICLRVVFYIVGGSTFML